MTPQQKLYLYGRVPQWVLARYGAAALVGSLLAWDAVSGHCYDSRFGSQTFDQMWACTRAISGTGHSFDYAVDSAGNWQPFGANQTRRTDLGVTIEESRTNSIRNNTWQGGVTGVIATGGAIATNVTWNDGATGITLTVNSFGTVNGVDVANITVSGTPTGTGDVSIRFDTATQIAATYGQTWTSSFLQQLTAGAMTNISPWYAGLYERTSGGAGVSSDFTAISAPTSSLLRGSASFTLTGATTAFIMPALLFHVVNGSPINATFNIGWPQLENNNINSTVASAVKAADGAGGVNGSAVYSVGGGTGSAATLNVTWAGGVMTVNSVAGAGSYTVFPPSPATLTYVSGVASGWTGATVTLTPTDNSAKAFATTPIQTTSAAVTRNADVVTLASVPVFGSAVSMYVKAALQAPVGFPNTIVPLQLSDGTVANRIRLLRSGNGTAATIIDDVVASAGQSTPAPAGTWTPSVNHKLAFALAVGDAGASLDGSAVATAAPASTPLAVINRVDLGNNNAANFFLNGQEVEGALWPAARITNSQVQQIAA